MLLEESLWIKYIINRYVEPNSLVLNIGSSTKHFIEVEQPYIKSNVLSQFELKKCTIKNIDIKAQEGVDLVGDVTDPNFISQIKTLAPAVIICTNLLEHLENRNSFCQGLMKIMNGSTLLIVSVPYSFPYHEDPIDTLYRPNIDDLQQDFERLRLIEGRIVKCGTFFSYNSNQKASVARCIHYLRICRGTIRAFFINRERFKDLLWYFKEISVSCAVFRISPVGVLKKGVSE